MNKIIGIISIIIFGLSLTAWAGPQEDLLDGCMKGDAAKVKAALDAGAKVNEVNAGGGTALAAAFFWPDITQMLLNSGADPNAGSVPALYMASYNYSVEVMKLLLAKGADPNKPLTTVSDPAAIFRGMVAAEKAKGSSANKILIKAWEDLIKQAAPPTKVESATVKTTIMQSNCAECLNLLVKAGARTDEKDADGANLIHVFANFGNSAEQRAERLRTGASAWESMGYAVPEWYKNLSPERNASADEILKILIGTGVDINLKTTGGLRPGLTPLMSALAGGTGSQKDIMLTLINNGADVTATHKDVGPALIQAVQCGFPEVVEAMHKKGADINMEVKMFDKFAAQYVDGFTPLIYATMMDNIGIVRYLLNNGAATTKGISGVSANVRAACMQNLKNKTAIFYAVETNDLDLVKFLVEKKIYNNKKMVSDQWKMKYEITKADFGQYKWVEKTIRCLEDGEYSPSEYAKKLDQTEMQKYLEENGI